MYWQQLLSGFQEKDTAKPKLWVRCNLCEDIKQTQRKVYGNNNCRQCTNVEQLGKSSCPNYVLCTTGVVIYLTLT